MSDGLKPHWFQILLALSGGARHGTAIMEEVLERTDGSMKLWPATLYGALRDLEEEGSIRETDPAPDAPTEGGRRRFYALTSKGQRELRLELRRWEAILDVARSHDLLGDPKPT